MNTIEVIMRNNRKYKNENKICVRADMLVVYKSFADQNIKK